jgi:MFS family permease
VVTLLPAMLADLSLPIDRIETATPIVTGFLLGYVAAMPLLGAYSDASGRLPVFLACLLLFAAGSALTASSQTLGFMVAGRLLQGLGGGGLVPLALALAADLYPAGSRAPALGAVSALQEAGSVLGPLYGAGVAAAAAAFGGWRFVFWLNLPLALVCGLGLALGMRRLPDSPSVEGRRAVEWAGAALLGAGLGLLLLGLYPDDPARRPLNAYAAPLLAGAAVALGLFGWRQVRLLDPLVPRQLLLSRPFLGSLVANLLAGGALMVVLLDVPVLARAVFSVDQLQAGLLLTQFLVGIPVGALAGGLLTSRLGGRPVAVLGLATAALAFVLMTRWQANELSHRLGPVRPAELVLGLCGLGFGLVIAPLAAAVLDATRRREHGLASSLVVLARTSGMLLALSALTAFGLHRFYSLLAAYPPPTGDDLHARLKLLEQHVTSALVEEYHEIFAIAAALCLLAALVAAVSLGGRRPPSAEPG